MDLNLTSSNDSTKLAEVLPLEREAGSELSPLLPARRILKQDTHLQQSQPETCFEVRIVFSKKLHLSIDVSYGCADT